MRETLELGPCPHGEECAQVGSDDYGDRSRAEVRAYIGQLVRTCGEPAEGVSLRCKSFPHDFGSYVEAVVSFDCDDESQCEYAYRLESKGPEFWDAEARKELGLAEG